MTGLRRTLQITAGFLLATAVIAYGLFQFQDFWRGPTISIQKPEYGAEITDPLISINGKANRIAFLSLNGRQIYTNPDGRFREELLLNPGHNIITVAARDTFGRQTKKQIEVTLSDDRSLNPLSFYEQFPKE